MDIKAGGSLEQAELSLTERNKNFLSNLLEKLV